MLWWILRKHETTRVQNAFRRLCLRAPGREGICVTAMPVGVQLWETSYHSRNPSLWTGFLIVAQPESGFYASLTLRRGSIMRGSQLRAWISAARAVAVIAGLAAGEFLPMPAAADSGHWLTGYYATYNFGVMSTS